MYSEVVGSRPLQTVPPVAAADRLPGQSGRTAAGLQRHLQAELGALDTRLRATLDSDVALIRAISDYIVSAGGKRLRPFLVGAGARIDAGGFLASTLDVSDTDFLKGADLFFRGESEAAVTHWLELHATLPKQRMPALADPLGPPRELPMPLTVAEGQPVVFVPYIPGSGAESLLRALGRGASISVLTDRNYVKLDKRRFKIGRAHV